MYRERKKKLIQEARGGEDRGFGSYVFPLRPLCLCGSKFDLNRKGAKNAKLKTL
jgi:hypothetical protein